MKKGIQALCAALGIALIIGLAACGSNDNGEQALPDAISLPDGFRPEGVAIFGASIFTGSIPSGRIFRADITTGQGQVITTPTATRSAIGMKVDGRGRLYVAGGATG